MKKKGQISIFIIGGIIVVIAVLLFFFFRAKPEVGLPREKSSEAFLDVCLEETIRESVNIILLRGGSFEDNLYKRFKFDGEEFRNISYLCYTQNFYVPCVSQEPMLINHLKSEIKNYISSDVKDCFDEMVFSFEKDGYYVDAEYNGFEVDFISNRVIVDIDGEIVMRKEDEILERGGFIVMAPSKVRDLAIVVNEIISQEAEYCYFDYMGYSLLYPEFDIDIHINGDTKIYSVGWRDGNEIFRFAVRGCVIPPGF
jgi:hypothetical protein